MSAYWNFRQILDVYPDSSSFTCVGVTKAGARCGQSFLRSSDLSEAARILNTLDRQKSLKSSFDYLEELAYLTLCPCWHQKPDRSQVGQVSQRWEARIAQYGVLLRKQAENAAILKSKRALAKVKGKAEELAQELKEEKKDIVRSAAAITAQLQLTLYLRHQLLNKTL